MRKILPILLAISVYLTPLYPVYALTSATTSAKPRLDKALDKKEDRMDKVGDKIDRIGDKIASRSAAFKEKLAKFKDKAKATRVENINTNLNKVNERRTTHMRNVLEKVSLVLEELKSKTADLASAGKDVSAVNDAISEVETQWAQADSTVNEQAGKNYSIEINTESTVKADASSARNSLRSDLKEAHLQVVETRKALASAIIAFQNSIEGGNSGSQ